MDTNNKQVQIIALALTGALVVVAGIILLSLRATPQPVSPETATQASETPNTPDSILAGRASKITSYLQKDTTAGRYAALHDQGYISDNFYLTLQGRLSGPGDPLFCASGQAKSFSYSTLSVNADKTAADQSVTEQFDGSSSVTMFGWLKTQSGVWQLNAANCPFN